jgi:hypothetical protein
MITLDQVKDVPFKVKVTETNAFIREVPYKDQAKKPFQLVPDFDKLANHALHNHYCLSFINCPFHLDFENLIAHFDWCCRYLYFNFEQSLLRLEIFARLEQLHLDKAKLEYLIQALEKYPEAYSYALHEADDRQKWALLKKTNFQKCSDFQHIVATDRQQRSLLLQHLQSLLYAISPIHIPADPVTEVDIPAAQQEKLQPIKPTAKPREREASLVRYLKLNEDLLPAACNRVIEFLYDYLEPAFRRTYTLEEFSAIFTKEDGPTLELVKKANWDNQALMILFQELKNEKVLVVSWPVVEQKVKMFKENGNPFSGFSQLSSGKINTKKQNAVKKALEPLFALINKQFNSSRKK